MSNSAESRLSPAGNPDPRVPLMNLSTVRERMDSLQQFLSKSVNNTTLMSKDEMDMISAEISTAIQQIIVNGAALVACSQSVERRSDPPDLIIAQTKFTSQLGCSSNERKKPGLKVEESDDLTANCDIVEMDAVELLAEHVHFCEICGKGFKRDANLRMHMRAHGNQFKTPEALAKPDKGNGSSSAALDTERKRRFSCPYEGCNRNKKHTKFRPLKSVICVRNHFKRSHCPKMYSCNRCNKKSFSVVADLKSHLKHCGESRWKCSCGTTFSRKDKLFGHMALFEGHMPAIVGENEEEEEEEEEEIKREQIIVSTDEGETGIVKGEELIGNYIDNDDYFEGLLDGFGSMVDGYDLQDVLGSSTGWTNNGMEDFLFTGQS